MKAVVIGGGIMGLSSAWYLSESGWDVTVLEQGDFSNNCSYGNAGYVCPSHFIPLATPGIVQQGLKWMLNSKSPFYVEPRLSWPLISWGLQFMRHATQKHVAAAAIPLRDIALFSKHCYEQWRHIPGFEMAYEQKGLLEYFQTAANEEHAHHTAAAATQLGLEAKVLSATEVQAMEPHTTLQLRGGLFFGCDAHLYPEKLMKTLLQLLPGKGVVLKSETTVTGFEQTGRRVTKVLSHQTAFDCDVVVIATGSWSRELAQKAGIRIPLVPGRGYSVTLTDSPFRLNHPAVLQEGRVAITPMDGNKIRFGGTMEITSIKTPPRYKRVQGILEAVERYLPEFKISMPPKEQIWYGYRPCSADGLPYIGRVKENIIVATGHAMIGLSLGAGTGKLVSELAANQATSVDLAPFHPERFS